jgi:hypothetical protein
MRLKDPDESVRIATIRVISDLVDDTPTEWMDYLSVDTVSELMLRAKDRKVIFKLFSSCSFLVIGQHKCHYHAWEDV